jgi:hypothetical protein
LVLNVGAQLCDGLTFWQQSSNRGAYMADDHKVDDKSSGLLVRAAETIGSTLGSLAAKAGAAQKSIGETTSEVVRSVTPGKRKASAKKTKKAAPKKKSAKRTSKAGRSGKRASASKGKRSRGR